MTGKGNKKSLPLFQFVIVECGSDEFCKPVGYDEAAFGYIFFLVFFNPLLINELITNLSKKQIFVPDGCHKKVFLDAT